MPAESDVPTRDPPLQTLVDVLQQLQSSLGGQLGKVNSTLSGIATRLDKLEEKQGYLENQLNAMPIQSTPTSGNSESGSCGAKRNRLTPVTLQVFTFIIVLL